jgi:hypothetical protein
MSTSYEEKSVWITLAGLVIGLGIYFWVAGHMLADGVTDAGPYLPVFGVFVVLQVLITVVGHVVAAIWARPEGRDERDRVIQWRSEYRSSWILGVGVIAAIFALAVDVGSAWVANGLLAALFLSEVAARVSRLVDYRRGF